MIKIKTFFVSNLDSWHVNKVSNFREKKNQEHFLPFFANLTKVLDDFNSKMVQEDNKVSPEIFFILLKYFVFEI